MTREVYQKGKGRDSDAVYHLVEDCPKLATANAYRAIALDHLSEDTDCCKMCIQRAFLHEEAESNHCDCEYHELDLDSADGPEVVYPCPDLGFCKLVPGNLFRDKLASAGLDVEDLHSADEALDTSGPRGEQLAAKLEGMNPDVVTDGGTTFRSEEQDNPHGFVELDFARENIDPIIAGEKTVTYRVGFEPDLVPYQQLVLVDEGGEKFASATVATHYRMDLGAVALSGHAGHQVYDSQIALIEDLKRYYPNEDLGLTTEVDVIAFLVHESERDPRGESA